MVRYPCDGGLQAEMWDSRYEEREECKNLLCEVQKFVSFFKASFRPISFGRGLDLSISVCAGSKIF